MAKTSLHTHTAVARLPSDSEAFLYLLTYLVLPIESAVLTADRALATNGVALSLVSANSLYQVARTSASSNSATYSTDGANLLNITMQQIIASGERLSSRSNGRYIEYSFIGL